MTARGPCPQSNDTRLGREVIKTLHKLLREVGMSCFVCFVLRLKNREKKENLKDVPQHVFTTIA